MRFAFITATPWPALAPDDVLAATELRARGHDVVPVIWNSTPMAALDSFDAVVMRSPWDWYRQPLAFSAFIERLGDCSAPFFNPRSMLLEYLDKSYLLRLERLGVPIVPTRLLDRTALSSLPQVIDDAKWSKAVIKPTLSANSFNTHVINVGDAGWVLERLHAESDHDHYLVQPYLEEIERDGEWSFVFFGGRFSHAVRKFPKANDFRVQAEHGGRSEGVEAPVSLVTQAQHVISVAVPTSLYARVDGVVVNGTLRLMELEVVEPELFFRAHPNAPKEFADALLRRTEKPVR